MVDYKLKNTWAKMIDEEVNIIECIRLFEEGYDRIYIIDKLTNFFGMVIDKDNLANAWDEDNEVKWITYLTEEDYIYDISNDEVINEKAARLFSENKISSIPIVLNNKIEFVINTEKICEINETFLKMIIHRNAVEYFNQYENIYISSLSNDKLMSFYKIFIDFFDIRILDGENIEELFNKENILFIYDINFYDKLNINKISLIELDKILKLQYINYNKSVLSIESSWASVNIKECNVLNCIKLFDQGYNSIYIEDDNKKYVSTIFRHNFKEDLFKNNLKKWADCYVVYSENINELYFDLISNFFGNGRQEIPILMNGEIKASCCKTNKFDLPLFWDYISEVSIQEYFGDRKILLSSYSCELKIFYDRYKNYLNITILDNIEKLYQYFNKKYDIVIYSSDVWDIFDTITIDIRQVYLDLLGEYVKNFLEKKKIEYYYFEVPKHTYEIVNYNKRHSKELIKKMLPGITQSCINMGEYYIYPDIQSETRNVKNGNRKTMGNPINSNNSIFFYGACTNFGIDVSDEETIESYLQKIINVKHGKTYKVFNAGGMFGSDLIQDINSLYIILKQELKEEDIIIQLGFNMWKNPLIHNIDNYYSLIELFNKTDNRYQCYFDDWVGHLNKLGNETVAEYIYNKIFV